MTDSPVQQVWVIPADRRDRAPLPALVMEGNIAFYDRREQRFRPFNYGSVPFYATFDECRLAMIETFTADLADVREVARDIAATIEHVKLIPSVPFPSDALQHSDRQEEAVQEETQAEEVKPAKVERSFIPLTELKRPRRR